MSFQSFNQSRSVCFVVTALHPIGGAEIQVAQLAKAFNRRGWLVSVVCMLSNEGDLAADLRKQGVCVHYLGMQKGIPDLRGIVRLAAWLRREQPDVVHSHMVHANLLTRITRLFAPPSVFVSTVHNISEGGWLCELAYRLTDRLADKTTAICGAAANRYVRVKAARPQNLIVIPNGVDTTEFCPDIKLRLRTRTVLEIDERFIWLAVGRLCEQKHYANLLHAFAAIPENKAVLLIAGEGPERAELYALAVNLGIEKRTRFLGFRTDTATLMTAADGYAMSSRYEGMPMVLLEASACALPIVATDVGGNAEVVKFGRLVPPLCPGALSQAMADVMAQSNEVRAESGAAARSYIVRHFSMESVVSQWEHLYHSLLQVRPASNYQPCIR